MNRHWGFQYRCLYLPRGPLYLHPHPNVYIRRTGLPKKQKPSILLGTGPDWLPRGTLSDLPTVCKSFSEPCRSSFHEHPHVTWALRDFATFKHFLLLWVTTTNLVHQVKLWSIIIWYVTGSFIIMGNAGCLECLFHHHCCSDLNHLPVPPPCFKPTSLEWVANECIPDLLSWVNMLN